MDFIVEKKIRLITLFEKYIINLQQKIIIMKGSCRIMKYFNKNNKNQKCKTKKVIHK